MRLPLHQLLAPPLAFICVSLTSAQGLDTKCSLQKPLKEVLAKAKEIELFSLDPKIKAKDGKVTFKEWVVLGSTKIEDRVKRERILKELESAVANSTYGEMALCFQPRHGIRATVDKVTVELVICFECNRVKPYVNGKEARDEATKNTPEKYLDELLKAGGIPLAPKPKEEQ
jgi:hypothetical protein